VRDGRAESLKFTERPEPGKAPGFFIGGQRGTVYDCNGVRNESGKPRWVWRSDSARARRGERTPDEGALHRVGDGRS
jgi:hypothetical protein